MLRSLKKRLKRSKKSVPRKNPTHEVADIGAECGGDSEGEYRSGGDLQVDEADGIDSTMAPDINRGDGSQTVTQDRRLANQQLPASNPSTSTPGHCEGGNASECGRS